jgi:hypothetical protein
MTANYCPTRFDEQAEQTVFSFLAYERSPVLFGFLISFNQLVRSRRQKALFALPYLGEEIIAFRDEIDRGDKLIDVVARRYGISCGTVRRLRAFTASEIAQIDLPLGTIARAVETAARHLPESGGLEDFVSRALLVEHISRSTGIRMEELIRRAGRFSALPAMGYAPEVDFDIKGPLREIWRNVILPEVFQQAKAVGREVTGPDLDTLLSEIPQAILPVIGRAFYGAKGPVAILDLAESWWIRDGYPLSTPGGDFALHLLLRLPSWEPLLRSPVSAGDLQVMSLKDSQSLVEEGLAMRHCIGRYAIQCIYGHRHALSVRTGDGFRLSTALIEIGSAQGIQVVEHRGYGNGPVDARAANALFAAIQHLHSVLTLREHGRLEGARRARVEAAGGENDVTRRLYPVYSEHLREWWFRAYLAPYLPQPYRSSDLKLWLTDHKLRDLATRLVSTLGSRAARAA